MAMSLLFGGAAGMKELQNRQDQNKVMQAIAAIGRKTEFAAAMAQQKADDKAAKAEQKADDRATKTAAKAAAQLAKKIS